MLQLGVCSYVGAHVIHLYGEDEQPVIHVGNYCSLGNHLEFLPGGMHDLNAVSTFPWQLTGRTGRKAKIKGPITIGHDVWIGSGVKVLGNVTIGTGCVIGAYSVVTRSLPAYHMQLGTRVLPRETHLPFAERLLKIAWWYWEPHDPRLDDVELLSVEAFCNKYDPKREIR